MSIATKTGDNGTTGLMFNRRVSKTDARVGACGACDELNAALGLARAWNPDPFIAEKIFAVQKELVILMGELACLEDDRARYVEKGFFLIEERHVSALTAWIDDLEKNHRISYQHWATPGATQGSAMLDQARAICRRAERAVWGVREQDSGVTELIPQYLNRLSDLCWLWARYVETRDGVAG
jgi:cob(I)alamin adenosyltransferase